MGALNSGISTKAFSYNFNGDGIINAGTNVFSGVYLKAGEVCVDVKAVVKSPLIAPVGTIFQVNGVGLFTGLLYSELTSVINGYGVNVISNGIVGASKRFSDALSIRFPFNSNIDLAINFGCTGGPVTGGSVAFIMTYQYAKF